MGLWKNIKSSIHKTIQKLKQIGSIAIKKDKIAIKTVYSDAKEFIEIPLKTINNLLTSPTFMISINIANVATVMVLPKVLK